MAERRSIHDDRGGDSYRRSSRDDDRGGRGRDDDRGRSSRDRDDDRDRGGRGRDDDRGSSRSGSGFSYRARSAEDVRKRANESSKDFDSYLADHIRMWKPNDGFNQIRILPPTWDDPKHYAVDVYVHYSIGPDQQAYLCLRKMKGEDCPICEERDRARREGESEEYIKDLEPTRRSLFYLVDRDHEKDGVQAWAAPFSKIDQAIVKVSVDRSTGDVLPIDHPDEGYDIEFEKSGKGIGTQYTAVAIARRSSPLGDKRWLQYALDNPLPQQLEYFSYDHMNKVLGGAGGHKTRSERDEQREERGSASRGRSGEDDYRDRSADRDRDGRGSRDEGRERGGRDRGRDDDRPSRGADRSRGSGGDKLTWAAVHSMSGKELDALVDEERLDIRVNDAESDAELAGWICKALGIEEEEHPRSRGRDDDDDSPGERLREMRNRRS